MHITKNVEKVKTLYGGKLRNFVSYFQSVTTIGVVTTARNPIEAEALSKVKMEKGQFVSGIFNQSPYTLSETEEWQPNFSGVAIDDQKEENSVDIMLSLGEDTIAKIATRLNKQPNEISEDDCLQFLKSSLDNSLA